MRIISSFFNLLVFLISFLYIVRNSSSSKIPLEEVIESLVKDWQSLDNATWTTSTITPWEAGPAPRLKRELKVQFLNFIPFVSLYN